MAGTVDKLRSNLPFLGEHWACLTQIGGVVASADLHIAAQDVLSTLSTNIPASYTPYFRRPCCSLSIA